MKKLLAATALLMALITPSLAGPTADVGCSLTTEKGQEIGYGFQDVADGLVIETTYLNRNGEAVVHPNNERPVWIMENFDDSFTLTFKRDPQYRLLVTPMKAGQALASLYKGRVKIAMGACFTEKGIK